MHEEKPVELHLKLRIQTSNGRVNNAFPFQTNKRIRNVQERGINPIKHMNYFLK